MGTIPSGYVPSQEDSPETADTIFEVRQGIYAIRDSNSVDCLRRSLNRSIPLLRSEPTILKRMTRSKVNSRPVTKISMSVRNSHHRFQWMKRSNCTVVRIQTSRLTWILTVTRPSARLGITNTNYAFLRPECLPGGELLSDVRGLSSRNPGRCCRSDRFIFSILRGHRR